MTSRGVEGETSRMRHRVDGEVGRRKYDQAAFESSIAPAARSVRRLADILGGEHPPSPAVVARAARAALSEVGRLWECAARLVE